MPMSLQPIRVPERFYRNGPPHWRQGRKQKRAETAAQAARAWRRHIKRLKREAKAVGAQQGHEQAPERRQLLLDGIEVIEGCGRGHRCHHDACPKCMRARQRWFVWTAPIALKKAGKLAKQEGAELAVLSVVPNLRLAPRASVKHIQEQLTRILNTIRRNLTEAGIHFLIGGIDISANEDRRDSKRRGAQPRTATTRFQLHLWAIGLEGDIRQAEAAIRNAFGRSTTVRRPVLIGAFDGDNRGYAYGLKTSFTRRISYTPKAAADDASVTTNTQDSWKAVYKRHNTRGKKLTAAQAAEVTILLGQLGFHRRLFLIGAHVTANDKGVPVIRPSGSVPGVVIDNHRSPKLGTAVPRKRVTGD